VTDDPNIHGAVGIVNGVDDPILAHPEAPQVFGPLQLPDAGSSRIGAESLNSRNDSARRRLGKPFQSFLRAERVKTIM
jgi:hypothetical protein